MRKITFALALCLCLCDISAQVTFTDQSQLLNDGTFVSYQPSAIADMNGDKRDDIVRISNSNVISIEYQNTNGNFGNYTINNGGEQPWGMCIADIDNNGYNDMAFGGTQNVRVLTANNSGTFYSLSVLPENIFVQGINFADIDNDGDNDLFSCHDVGTSLSWRNNGFGTMTNDPSLITTSPYAGNYASVWSDFDNDGDLDMYLSKCRLGESSPTAPTRINGLYQNNGNGTFSNVAAAFGVADGEQSWSADFADIDNDGDMDLFVLNHTGFNRLFINENNIFTSANFTDVILGSGIALNGGSDWQSIFRDFDNDGYVDLLISGANTELYWNNGNNTFTPEIGNNPFSSLPSFKNFSIGDLNHDGFLDIFANFNAWASSGGGPDRILFNNKNSNHFLAINLQGVVSNPNGIGAKLKLCKGGVCQIREVRSGESYGIMNSLTQHFGIGQNTSIDSLVINWPSGIKQLITNPTADTFMEVIEQANTLPLSWVDFTATLDNDVVDLEWVIADEFQNAYFEIERSSDARDFQTLAKIPATNAIKYNKEDLNPSQGSNYYRIKQVDESGAFSYSSIEEIKYEDEKVEVNIYPNPLQHNTALNIDLNLHRNTLQFECKIMSVNGLCVFNASLNSYMNNMDLDLNPGLYFIEILEDGELIKTEKVVLY